jgi:hypothetical protein|nr:MAG TPA: hypothetical protein [Caudoviricetes sp.]
MYFAILFSITTLISGGLLLWLYTPKGKKWLRDL